MLLPILLMGSITALFFLHPKNLKIFSQTFTWVAFGLLSAVTVFAVSILSYVRIKGAKPKSIGVNISYPGGFDAPAFVGAGGYNAPLALHENSDALILHESMWTIVPKILGTALFGPLMLFVYFHSARTFGPSPPLPFAILVGALVTLSCVFFVTNLFKFILGGPQIEIYRQSIRFYKYRKLIKTTESRDISKIASKSFLYNFDDGLAVPNFVVYAKLITGVETPLCITDKSAQLNYIKDYLIRNGYEVEFQHSPQ